MIYRKHFSLNTYLKWQEANLSKGAKEYSRRNAEEKKRTRTPRNSKAKRSALRVLKHRPELFIGTLLLWANQQQICLLS